MTANGHFARFYIAGPPGADRFYLTVLYARSKQRAVPIDATAVCGVPFTYTPARHLTISPKLLARVLRH